MDGGIFVNMVSFWRVYQMNIIHPMDFQNFDLCFSYLTFNFTLESMRKTHNQKSLKESTYTNLLVESYIDFLYIKISDKIIHLPYGFLRIKYFLILPRSDNSS
jgi:hypothetical protein